MHSRLWLAARPVLVATEGKANVIAHPLLPGTRWPPNFLSTLGRRWLNEKGSTKDRQDIRAYFQRRVPSAPAPGSMSPAAPLDSTSGVEVVHGESTGNTVRIEAHGGDEAVSSKRTRVVAASEDKALGKSTCATIREYSIGPLVRD